MKEWCPIIMTRSTRRLTPKALGSPDQRRDKQTWNKCWVCEYVHTYNDSLPTSRYGHQQVKAHEQTSWRSVHVFKRCKPPSLRGMRSSAERGKVQGAPCTGTCENPSLPIVRKFDVVLGLLTRRGLQVTGRSIIRKLHETPAPSRSSYLRNVEEAEFSHSTADATTCAGPR